MSVYQAVSQHEASTTTYRSPDTKANIELARLLLPTSSKDPTYSCSISAQDLPAAVSTVPARISMPRGPNLVTSVQCNSNVLTHVQRGLSDMVPTMITDIAAAKDASEEVSSVHAQRPYGERRTRNKADWLTTRPRGIQTTIMSPLDSKEVY